MSNHDFHQTLSLSSSELDSHYWVYRNRNEKITPACQTSHIKIYDSDYFKLHIKTPYI